MPKFTFLASVFLLASSIAGASTAQTLSTQSQAGQTSPSDPGSPQAVPEKGSPAQTSGVGASPGGADLSKKLDRSNGVIEPPSNVDPGIQKSAPTPNPNSTPVIRPPETGAQPK